MYSGHKEIHVVSLSRMLRFKLGTREWVINLYPRTIFKANIINITSYTHFLFYKSIIHHRNFLEKIILVTEKK